jgi:hypothetical protein
MRLDLLIFFILLAALSCYGQQVPATTPPDAINLTGLTTPVEVQFADGRQLSGSGFFYFVFAEEAQKKAGPHWVAIAHIYLVTAKHVIQPNRIKDILKFTYALRVGDKDQIAWHRLEMNGMELSRKLHICKNEQVDVAVVDIYDQLMTEDKKLLSERAQVLSYNGTSSEQFPGKSPLEVQPGDDVIVIGYPLGIYDSFNKLPILKTGVLNTPVGMHFEGMDAFVFDFKYYEGLSGSIIISKPTHIGVTKEGILQSSAVRQYVFLGVYQGEYYWNDIEPLRADLGLGWYYYNVEEAIKNAPLIH